MRVDQRVRGKDFFTDLRVLLDITRTHATASPAARAEPVTGRSVRSPTAMTTASPAEIASGSTGLIS
jgi:hypothetical protein